MLVTPEVAELLAVEKRSNSDVRLMVRVAQLYYRLHLSQQEIGDRIGLSRFQVGRLLDRAVEESIVRIEVVHPDARLVELEDALVTRFRLDAAVVADVPAATPGNAADDVAREAVAEVAVALLAQRAPTGSIGVSWGRTMLAVARRLPMGWTKADEIVQLNGATLRSAQPTRDNEIVERVAATTGASFRTLAAPAIVGTSELRDALARDPALQEALDAARA